MAAKPDNTTADPFDRLNQAGVKQSLLRDQLRVIEDYSHQMTMDDRPRDQEGVSTLFNLTMIALMVLDEADRDLHGAEDALFAAGVPELVRSGLGRVEGRA